MKNSLTLDV